MGGKNETTVPAKKSGKAGESIDVGSLRVHESGGEIHLHDDANKLKCAVPVATWSKEWSNLWKRVHERWTFADAENGTWMSATIVIVDGNAKIEIGIEELKISPELAKLNKFTEG